MVYTPDLIAELEILSLFKRSTTREGIKVHKNADEAVIAATSRLYNKGILSQPDGGYLTQRGLEAAEHADHLLAILSSQ
jgi:uncharacterized protein (TIGR02647 family)